MSYAEMLDAIISESDLSLRQISKMCTQFDISITPSYISQLKNGKLPPPSPEVSLALAKVCNSKNQSQLVFQGYMEKAPEVIREYMLASSQLNRIMLESLYRAENSNMSKESIEYLKNLDVLSTLEMSSRYISSDNNLRSSDLVREITLSSGGVSRVQAQGDMINFFLGDTSMSPTIPIHSYMYILPTRLELLKERDIIALYPNNRKQATLRKIFYSNGKILLIPEDKTYPIFIIDSFEDIDYIGKVVSYKVDL
ncbi:MAG TPA: S24 family peptidase [Anaerovoracaceae bacterium]|nr:S24 family peptidase [Anaerovoracaceae bacterium]